MSSEFQQGGIRILDGLVLQTVIGEKAHEFHLSPQEALELGRTLMIHGEVYRRATGDNTHDQSPPTAQ